MAIKSKKWKIIVSFCAFFMSVSLLLANGATLGSELWRNLADGNGKLLVDSDYQNTADFRGYIEDCLENFLMMAVGGDTDWDYYYDSGEDAVAIGYEDTVSKATAAENFDSYGELAEGYGYAEEPEMSAAQREAEIKQIHESMKNDKNLLYRISYEGKELYTNMEEVKWKKWGDELPDGYNFLLYFENGKASVVKDGQDIQDIYGDGYYRGENQWGVPGYKNFTVEKELEDAGVVIMAAETPVDYSYTKFGQDGYSFNTNRLYYIAESAEAYHQALMYVFVGIAAGILLFAAYLLLRKEKRAADAVIGRWLGNVAVELKILVLFAAVVTVIYLYCACYGYTNDIYYGESYFGDTFSNGAGLYFFAEFLHSILRCPSLLVITFWTVYLLALDLKRNRKVFGRGFISKFMEKFERKSLKLPFSKRMVRQFLPVFFVSVVLSIVAIALAAALCGWVDEPAIAVCIGLLFLGCFLGVCYWYLSELKKQACELDLLTECIKEIHDGNYETKTELPEDSQLREAADNLEAIRHGMESAIEERMKSERMKVELVANVSHDIKTPLTSIISYVEFLKQEEGLPEHIKDYIRILDEKSQRLKNMVQDVFAVSKAASGQLPVEPEKLDFGKLLRQTLADMDEQVKNSKVTVKAEIPEHGISIYADGQRMYRVFQNLIQNALNYSLDGSRVYITLREEETEAVARIKNTSRQELNQELDFAERFVRGDESRTDGGSGLGLSIAKSFTEACGGSFQIEVIADLFVVTISFPQNTEK